MPEPLVQQSASLQPLPREVEDCGPQFRSSLKIRDSLGWRLLATLSSRFIRWTAGRRGFYRTRKAVQRMARRVFDGHYVPVPYFEGTLCVDIGHNVDRWIFNAGVYEKGTIELIRAACSHGYSFADVGANLGSHIVAACLARLEETQRFVAVEPAPAALAILRHNLGRNHLDAVVEVLPFALSDREEVVPFYVTNGDNPGMNGLARTQPEQACIPVTARRLDEVMAPSVPAKLLVKLDVEGLEPRVLDGSSGLIESCADLVLTVEHAPENLARAGFDRTAVTMRLEARGFELWRINEGIPCLERFEPTRDGFCNFVAAKKLPACWRGYLGS